MDAGDLEPGDLILSLDGDYGQVSAVLVIVEADQRMYNLTVDEAHTFFVGEEIETTPWHPFYTDEGWEGRRG